MGLAKVAGSIEMQPEPATADSCGPKEPLVDELQHTGAKWQIQWNDLCGGGDVDCRFHYCSNSFFVYFVLYMNTYRVSGSTLTAVGRSQLLARWPGTH